MNRCICAALPHRHDCPVANEEDMRTSMLCGLREDLRNAERRQENLQRQLVNSFSALRSDLVMQVDRLVVSIEMLRKSIEKDKT